MQITVKVALLEMTAIYMTTGRGMLMLMILMEGWQWQFHLSARNMLHIFPHQTHMNVTVTTLRRFLLGW